MVKINRKGVNDMITLDADKKIAKAKTYLILKHPFYGSTLLSSVVREDNTVQTMATDGSSTFWNRAFVLWPLLF